MDEVAEHGIAAHWKYKGKSSQLHLRETFSWFSLIEDLSEDLADSKDFVERTRESLISGEVLVLSPQGEIVSLPEGSTPLDFAYYIHTDLGHLTGSARVNGVDVPLDYELRNGDVVEIIKSEKGIPSPKPEWLNIVKSPRSIVKIKHWFRKAPRKERVKIGRYLLRSQIEKEGLYPLNLMDNVRLLGLLKALDIRRIDEMFDQIATGSLMARDVVRQLKLMYMQKAAHQERRLHDRPWQPYFHYPVGLASEFGTVLKGGKPLRRKVELSPCCTPVCGDPIVGVDNRKEHRVEIHHRDCPTVSGKSGEGIVHVEWTKDCPEMHYPATIITLGLNRVGLLFEVLRKLSDLGVSLIGGYINLRPSVTHEDEVAESQLSVEVEGLEHLNKTIAAVSGVEDVISVRRNFESGAVS